MWQQVMSSALRTEKIGFLNSLSIYAQRPNLINKRIFGSRFISAFRLQSSLHVNEIYMLVKKQRNEFQSAEFVIKTLSEHHGLCLLENQTVTECFEGQDDILLFNSLLPRSCERFTEELEILLIQPSSQICIFIPLSTSPIGFRLTPNCCYKFQMDNKGFISLHTSTFDLEDEQNSVSVEWLKTHVFGKIVKWANSSEKSANTIGSLSLVQIDVYNKKRLELRQKYAQKFIELWPDDGTDPLKFVHEDIAIAAYLLTLWENETNLIKSSKPSFVDLGCGNGLLTYILTKEGHLGIGLDLRERKLWKLLGPDIDLRESVVSPSEHSLFPNHDWIIGNHSDELTPWIPIIAARSSYNMKVFLLPCCPHTFNGKYQRTQANMSQYQSYLVFVEDLCKKVGFNVFVDKLRIPSTKRTCFVCPSRNYKQINEALLDECRIEFIRVNSKPEVESDAIIKKVKLDEKWSNSFTPREKTEKVQNCTQLGKEFLDNIIIFIASILMAEGEGEHHLETMEGTKSLRYGRSLILEELAGKLKVEMKTKLKQQNGGLQTLLRNHRHVFEIKNGNVRITAPLSKNINASTINKKNQRINQKIPLQSRPCWFFWNHPQKCPFADSECRYSHKC